ncbi:hypothetical protein [Streptomyces kanamyceticus]|uniref:Uncharacterized protein n=1 Tax=Streptomyces kanamyceticus TaxID=1967 RepID=A0A5J6G7B6_STRKN|nr:hypothetical protein [Streptomyces kanamyceticus]QEU89828.1 hypothetical protein CP970_01695 [Streptomyces kanamyceticus]
MIKEWRHRRALQRVMPGDGRELKRFRWWQSTFRALFHLRLTGHDGRTTVYAVDVRHWQNQSSGNVKAHLYLDGRLHAESKLPAVFPVPGGTVDVRMSGFGLKRCHYVTDAGDEFQLVPDPDSAEGRRARLDRAHPALSRTISLLSLCVLVAALAVLVPQLAEQLTKPEEIAQRIGTFTSPIDVPKWGYFAIGVATLAASTERALRLRHSRLLDGAAG